ncbi:hypothetical protein QVH35_02170 [Candidatus Nitrosotenuis chungbukensis]|nr:hypothetical protein [Candidatus Nitrosotenuis chungbukensis]WKT58290.1 hypothetical protein QVH35_02170 [Candidatus Nitrosotenuis chungbukensis]
MRIYDFSGGEVIKPDIDAATKKADSLLFYKSKWGGEPKEYYVFIKVRKKISYKIYRLLFGLMRRYHRIIKQ